jgi:D-xylose transport system ATP-binding protein
MATSDGARPVAGDGAGRDGSAGRGEPLLRATGISKRFGAVEALVGVDFDVYGGEVVALVGDNGAGKSTLTKAISGVQPADDGRFAFEGRPVGISTAQDAVRLGIATVYQDLALCDNLDVVANLYLGREAAMRGVPGALRVLDEVSMEGRTRELLSSLGVTTLSSVRSEVGGLSGGQRQAVAIARSLLGEPRLVILDEPTAALGVTQTAQVLELIGRLRERGLGVVLISHNMHDVFRVSDRIAVMRLGRLARTFDRRETTQSEVVAAITGATSDGEAAA